jgi:predicted O-methyltransferase YrrM
MDKECNSVRPSFMFLLNEIPEGEIKGVEIGTSVGKNAVRMLDFCDRFLLVCVDIKKLKEMDGILNTYKERVKFIHKPSVEAAEYFSDNYFDYVYIDGEHDEKNVFEDMKAWYPKLRMGGVLSGHDWWLKSVQQGVVKFFDNSYFQCLFAVQSYHDKKYNLESHHAEFMDWWFVKHPEDYKV